jgi:hypothetical protein
MKIANDEKDFWKEIYTRLDYTTAKERNEGKTGQAPVRYWTLVIKPILKFLNSYIIGGNFLKGRKGYNDSVHGAVLLFAENASRYEVLTVGKNLNNPLDDIKKEW